MGDRRLGTGANTCLVIVKELSGLLAPSRLLHSLRHTNLLWGGGWGFVVKLVVVSEKIYIFLSLELFNKFYRYS